MQLRISRFEKRGELLAVMEQVAHLAIEHAPSRPDGHFAIQRLRGAYAALVARLLRVHALAKARRDDGAAAGAALDQDGVVRMTEELGPIAKALQLLVDVDVKRLFTHGLDDEESAVHALSVAGTLRTAGDAWRRLQRLVRVGDMLNEVEAVAAAFARDEVGAVLGALHRALTTSNPGGEPRNTEAVRQLIFFCNSMHNRRMKRPPPVAHMKPLTSFTPHYAEDVTYSIAALNGAAKAGATDTLLHLLRSLNPDEWEHMCERLCVQSSAAVEELAEEEQKHVMRWASDRAQVLSRTVRGVMRYGDALRVLARLEGLAEDELEPVVRSKFEYAVTCQIYARLRDSKKEDDKWKAAGIDELRRRYAANLRVAYVEGDPKKPAEGFNSLLLGIDGPVGAQKDVVLCKIALPGNPILGEGKPENQNHAIVFTRGEYLQTLDMNQDNYMGEAYKMRNLLEGFQGNMRIVGMREHIFSESGGAVAHFAAANEFVFGTIVQRFLTWPLRARFHYGHPDVWDKTWALTSGGISKSSKTLHVSEDIFGGFNTVLRGGGIEYYEFIHCGKGRDMGFTAVNGFETKISAGNSLQCCSRDLYRLGKSFDLFRLFSMFFSGSGFYMTTMFTLWAVYMFAYGQLLHALCGAELFVHREWAPADAPPPPPAPSRRGCCGCSRRRSAARATGRRRRAPSPASCRRRSGRTSPPTSTRRRRPSCSSCRASTRRTRTTWRSCCRSAS